MKTTTSKPSWRIAKWLLVPPALGISLLVMTAVEAQEESFGSLLSRRALLLAELEEIEERLRKNEDVLHLSEQLTSGAIPEDHILMVFADRSLGVVTPYDVKRSVHAERASTAWWLRMELWMLRFVNDERLNPIVDFADQENQILSQQIGQVLDELRQTDRSLRRRFTDPDRIAAVRRQAEKDRERRDAVAAELAQLDQQMQTTIGSQFGYSPDQQRQIWNAIRAGADRDSSSGSAETQAIRIAMEPKQAELKAMFAELLQALIGEDNGMEGLRIVSANGATLELVPNEAFDAWAAASLNEPLPPVRFEVSTGPLDDRSLWTVHQSRFEFLIENLHINEEGVVEGTYRMRWTEEKNGVPGEGVTGESRTCWLRPNDPEGRTWSMEFYVSAEMNPPTRVLYTGSSSLANGETENSGSTENVGDVDASSQTTQSEEEPRGDPHFRISNYLYDLLEEQMGIGFGADSLDTRPKVAADSDPEWQTADQAAREILTRAKQQVFLQQYGITADDNESALAAPSSAESRKLANLEATWGDQDAFKGEILERELYQAALLGRTHVASWLIARGVSVNAYDAALKQTPLHAAVEEGQLEMISLLLQAGADPAATDGNGRSSLHLAKEGGDEALVRQLHVGRTTAILRQLMHGDLPALEQDEANLLMTAQQRWHVMSEGQLARALLVAVQKGHSQLADRLLALGADPNGVNASNETALGLALVNRDEDIAIKLVEAGADLTWVTDDRRTPLHQAVEFGCFETLQAILERGVDVDARDANGNSALHLASQAGEIVLVRELLTSGASPLVENDEGEVPADLARGDNAESIRLLLELIRQDSRRN